MPTAIVPLNRVAYIAIEGAFESSFADFVVDRVLLVSPPQTIDITEFFETLDGFVPGVFEALAALALDNFRKEESFNE